MKNLSNTQDGQASKASGQILPYERFLRFGPENLTESELLAIILRTGTKDASALELADRVLALTQHPRKGLLGLYDLTLEDLMKIKGIGLVKAVKLKSLAELSMRISCSRASRGLSFHNAGKVAEYYMEKLRHLNTESVYLLCLDTKAHLIHEEKISDGSVRMALISPREIFLKALEHKAVNILLLHNHPSGDPAPSSADFQITKDLAELGTKMDIPLLDHIIIGDNEYFSFKEANNFQNF
ncbi:MAG: DNA repair protein RadC [Lachnospiraceae bacterium]|nr:DNA repair protein RadC [Lachnospiraceae bacterium]